MFFAEFSSEAPDTAQLSSLLIAVTQVSSSYPLRSSPALRQYYLWPPGLLKTQMLGPTLEVLIRPVLAGTPQCVSNKITAKASAASLGTTLQECVVYYHDQGGSRARILELVAQACNPSTVEVKAEES